MSTDSQYGFRGGAADRDRPDYEADPEMIEKIKANLEAIRKDYTERYGFLPPYIDVHGDPALDRLEDIE